MIHKLREQSWDRWIAAGKALYYALRVDGQIDVERERDARLISLVNTPRKRNRRLVVRVDDLDRLRYGTVCAFERLSSGKVHEYIRHYTGHIQVRADGYRGLPIFQ